MANQAATEAPAPAPAPAPAAAPQQAPGAQENSRFSNTEILAKVPEKFRKGDDVNLDALVTSYSELETRFNTKTEDLRKTLTEELQAEQLKARPESPDKYELPEIEGLVAEEFAAHPMVEWWRTEAHTIGLPQEKFEEVIAKYVESIQPPTIDVDAVKADLGDNADARISAVDAWAKKAAKSEKEMAHLMKIAIDADGIKLLERLAGMSDQLGSDGNPAPRSEVSLEDLKSMQQDPRYWDAARRDPAFVKKIEEGYEKLYG